MNPTPQAYQPTEALSVSVSAHSVTLAGDLVIPDKAIGVVLFAHGSGSSRTSPRNRHVAQILQQAGLATLLMDLLTPAEAAEDMYHARLRFDIPLLAERLIGAVDWCQHHPIMATRLGVGPLPIGLFGASTGAAAALVAASKCPSLVKAVVSRGGRPDLAGSALAWVQAPTLLIVGGKDYAVIEMNQAALISIQAEKRLEIIPGATHLFEEQGALEEVAKLASQWFRQYLTPSTQYQGFAR
jgi:putative phosphoribosyl transferase